MRRRPAPVAPALPQSDVPLVLVVGPLVGVHGDNPLAATARWRELREAWVQRVGLDRREANRLLRARGPSADVLARLARHGLTEDALPALRRAAQPFLR